MHSAGSATPSSIHEVILIISIHASTEGCNVLPHIYVVSFRYFNSCIPEGCNKPQVLLLLGLILFQFMFQFMRPAMGATETICIKIYTWQFQFMRPRWVQLQDLDTILLSILHLVYKRHFPIQSYLKITSILFIFWCECPSIFMFASHSHLNLLFT